MKVVGEVEYWFYGNDFTRGLALAPEEDVEELNVSHNKVLGFMYSLKENSTVDYFGFDSGTFEKPTRYTYLEFSENGKEDAISLFIECVQSL